MHRAKNGTSVSRSVGSPEVENGGRHASPPLPSAEQGRLADVELALAAVAEAPEMRHELVARLREEITHGDYDPCIDRLAEKLIWRIR
jgi:anti-sigma28 factor (negative regulator of flagellin synthesis)